MASLNAALAGVGRQLDSQRGQAAADSVSARKAAPMPAPAPAPAPYVDSDDEASDAGGGGAPADDSPILVFCRIRPPLRGTAAGKSMLAVDAESKKVEFNLSRADADSAHNTINNSREQFKFSFNGLFPEDTTQAQMFDGVAVRVLENVTAGYNGTCRDACDSLFPGFSTGRRLSSERWNCELNLAIVAASLSPSQAPSSRTVKPEVER